MQQRVSCNRKISDTEGIGYDYTLVISRRTNTFTKLQIALLNFTATSLRINPLQNPYRRT